MIAYFARIAGAWLLLRFASALVKDAETLLRESAKTVPTPEPEVTDAEVVEGEAE